MANVLSSTERTLSFMVFPFLKSRWDRPPTAATRFTMSTSLSCRTVNVIRGDTCGSLATKCGISATNFNKYNTEKNLCSTLTPGQRLCCSAGSLPDIRPKPNTDGSCHTYQVNSQDTCSSIAAANGLKASDISDFNDKKTWGWFGCDNLQTESHICLSNGEPPMPVPVSNAQRGPTVP